MGLARAGDLGVAGRAGAVGAKIPVQADKGADLSKQIAALGSQHRPGRADGIPVGNGAAHLLLVRHVGAPPTPPIFARDFSRQDGHRTEQPTTLHVLIETILSPYRIRTDDDEPPIVIRRPDMPTTTGA